MFMTSSRSDSIEDHPDIERLLAFAIFIVFSSYLLKFIMILINSREKGTFIETIKVMLFGRGAR